MAKSANPTIDAKFNLFREGRKYTGHHRKYVLENAQTICESPETREKIRLREALGYFGHGRRILAGKLALGEVETVKMPNGQSVIIENIPACVTTKFSVAPDGTVLHTQEILTENAPGKVVLGLHNSRIGGFSWACGGRDGGGAGLTRLSDFHGFDYVLQPGFAENRGYVLESVDGDVRQAVLENIHKQGVSETVAENYLNSWVAQESLRIPELEKEIELASVTESALRETLEKKTGRLAELERMEAKRREAALAGSAKTIIAIPQNVMESIISMADEHDFLTLISFIEAARQVDLSGLPGGRSSDAFAPAHPRMPPAYEGFGGAVNAPRFDM